MSLKKEKCMTILKPSEGIRSTRQMGKIGGYAEFGRVWYGHGQYGHSFEEAGIYQMRMCKIGSVTVGTQYHYEQMPIRMKFYQPTGEPHAGQIAQRQKMRDAVLAWQSLTDEEKAVYHTKAVSKRMSGYNLFLKESMSS